MKASLWPGRRVLVTGHTGFKGSWLSLWLQQLGAEVTGLALRPDTTPSLYELAAVERGLSSHIGDIRELNTVRQVLQSAAPEIVFHLAAQPLVRHSYDQPIETIATNVMGTAHVLEAVRSTPSVRVVIVVTTDKCYQNREWVWGYREDEPMGGRDPYSASKGCAELLTAAYRQSFFEGKDRPAIASVRAGNVIGGGDWAENRLIPDLARAFSEGRPAHIRSPSAIRPWQHVLDALHGYLILAQRLWDVGHAYADGWNFGPWEHDARTVEWIASRFAERWGNGARWIGSDTGGPHEATYLRLDSAKARVKLGWFPRLSLEDAMDLTIEWYRAWASRADMRKSTMNQLDAFGAIAS